MPLANLSQKSPDSPDRVEVFTVSGLQGGTTYYFGLKIVDETGNSSPIVATSATTGPGWSREVVVSSSWLGKHTALAYDPSDGNPSIGYQDLNLKRAMFAHWNGTTWEISSADTQRSGSGLDLAYDPGNGQPSLSYFWNGKLSFSHRNGSSWNVQAIDTGVSNETSLAYDPDDGEAAIAYIKRGAVKFARRSGSAWNIETVDPAAIVEDVSLAYDKR